MVWFALLSCFPQALAGFPPKAIDLASCDAVASSVSNNEVVRIDCITDMQRTNAPLAPSPGSKKLQAIAKSGTRSTAGSPNAVGGTVKFGAKIATLKPALSSRKPPGNKVGGYSSASAVMGSTAVPAKKKRMLKFKMTSMEDVGDQLLKAASGGGGGNKKDKFLRSVFRRAVELEYDQAVAHSRVAAALGNRYTFVDTASNLSGEVVSMMVTFPKGMGSRLILEDRVDFLALDKLRAVVMFVLSGMRSASASDVGAAHRPGDLCITEMDFETKSYNRNMLKPAAMAGCSPRVFWSLVRHFGGDIISGLSQLMPQENWSWLAERPRRLSAKAAENEEVKREELETRARKKRKTECGVEAAPSDLSTSIVCDPISGDSFIDDWKSNFLSSRLAKVLLVSLLSRIFKSEHVMLDIFGNGDKSEKLSSRDKNVFGSLMALLFPDSVCVDMGGTGLFDWANAPVEPSTHLQWSYFHYSQSKNKIDSHEAGADIHDCIRKSLTVWNFYDIIYEARRLSMQELWQEFCSDVFTSNTPIADSAQYNFLCSVVLVLALSADIGGLAELSTEIGKAIRPRDIGLWRLSAVTFTSKLSHFLTHCVSQPRFLMFSDLRISESDKVKLACEKVHCIRSKFTWIDSENWYFLKVDILKSGTIKNDCDMSPEFTLRVDDGSVLNIQLISSVPAIGNMPDSEYYKAQKDIEELISEDWIVSDLGSNRAKQTVLSRVMGITCAHADLDEDGTHLVGEIVARNFEDDDGQIARENGVIIAFAPVLIGAEDNNEDEDIPLWKIQYKDGDREDLEEFEVIKGLSLRRACNQ